MDKKITALLKSLPPITACVVWDVLKDDISLKTIELADHVTNQEWESYDDGNHSYTHSHATERHGTDVTAIRKAWMTEVHIKSGKP